MISKDHLIALGLLLESGMDQMISVVNGVMDIVFVFFQAIDVTVFSLSLSFGKCYMSDSSSYILLLGNEVSLKNISISLY